MTWEQFVDFKLWELKLAGAVFIAVALILAFAVVGLWLHDLYERKRAARRARLQRREIGRKFPRQAP